MFVLSILILVLEVCNNSSHPLSYHSSMSVSGEATKLDDDDEEISWRWVFIDLSMAFLLNISGFMVAFVV